MKKLLGLAFVFTALLTQSPAMAEDELSIAKEKKVQEAVEREIIRIESMESTPELVAYLENKCNEVAANNTTRELAPEIMNDCYSKIERLESVGDLEIAKKVLISDLQKTQQARNLMFGFTRDTIDHMYGPGDLLVIWLPFAMIIDTALLPFTFVGSLLTGF
tara:strand:+ start:65551 stop:66036 length:486 start_codon:yes stop_codon:yes gene_type:complete